MDDLTRIQPVKRTSLALRCESTGKLHELIGEMLVGREVECEIQLESPKISRYHAKLYVSANGLYIEDLGSSNGTYLNGQKIRQRTHIGLGDKVSFDTLSYRVTTSRSGNADDTQLVTPPEMARSAEAAGERTPQSMGAALGRTHNQTPYQASLPPGQLGSAADSHSSDNSSSIRNTPSPDVQDFLEFAASGLKAQEPISREDANPFRMGANLSNKKPPDIDKGFYANRNSTSEALSDQRDEPAIVPEVRPEVRAIDAGVLKAAPEEDAHNIRQAAENAIEEDADKTKHVSLKAMDQYAFTNKKHQQDIDAGSGPRVIAMTAPIRGKVFPLCSDEDVTCWSIGRDDGADICIRDPGVSREHAWITKLETLYQLRVSSTASEIIVNGQAQTEVDLKHDDRLQFGVMELVFRLNESEPANNVTNVDSEKGLWNKVKVFLKRLMQP